MGRFSEILKEESNKDYYKKLHEFVENEYATKTIYPPKKNIFFALENTPYEHIRVVILGQDPYHGEGEAHGMAFSVNPGIKIPPSLQNIFKDTVEKDKPASHQGKGWEIFTDRIIEEINKKETPVVFMLWGNFAKQKQALITNPKHLVLTSSHPSPFSVRYGFEGCNHFKIANEFLKQNNIPRIDWQIENI